MNGLEITMTLGAAVFAGTVLAPRLRMPTPLLLLLLGLALAFVPELRPGTLTAPVSGVDAVVFTQAATAAPTPRGASTTAASRPCCTPSTAALHASPS